MLTIALFLPLMAKTAEAADPGTSLGPGATGDVWQGALTRKDAAARLRLDLHPGTYVAGKLQRPGTGLVLDLVREDDSHLRRLVDEDGVRDTFQFLVPQDAAFLKIHALDGRAEQGAPFKVAITQNLLPGEDVLQETPEEQLLSPTLQRVAGKLGDDRETGTFWDEMASRGTPLIEPVDDKTSIVTFLYRGAKTGVRILGAPSADHDPMTRLGETDIWYRSYELPNDTRLSYRLAPDVPEVPGTFWERRVAILATAQADPLNLDPWPAESIDRFSRKSVLKLPDAPELPFTEKRDGKAGTVRDMAFTSDTLGNTRPVSLYTPAKFDPSDPETVLLVLFDGEAYQSDVSVPVILDNMQADGVIPQTVAILIANPDLETRGRELPGNEPFADVIARELVPFAARELKVSVPPERTALAGSSYGGLASTRLALAYPEIFGNVISMSGSYWWSPEGTPPERAEYMANKVAAAERAGIRFFLTAGLFETGRAGRLDILNTNRHLRTVLDAKGYEVTLREYAGAHDYLIWQGALSDGLIALFGN